MFENELGGQLATEKVRGALVGGLAVKAWRSEVFIMVGKDTRILNVDLLSLHGV